VLESPQKKLPRQETEPELVGKSKKQEMTNSLDLEFNVILSHSTCFSFKVRSAQEAFSKVFYNQTHSKMNAELVSM